MSIHARPATADELEALRHDARSKRTMVLASIGMWVFLVLLVLFIPLDGEGMPPGNSAFRVVAALLTLLLTLVPIVTLTVYLMASRELRNALIWGVRD